MKTVYITTPIYYVNSSPHIGHAYTQVACDTLARFLRQIKRDVFFMTGSDEHGEKIEKATVEAGLKKGQEKEFVDGIVRRFTGLWEKLSIRYDRFIRTTDPIHEETVRAILGALYANGDIYKKIYQGWFCTPCEAFWSWTQAEKGICPDCGRPCEKLDEENYFFRMSKYQKQLIECIEKKELVISPAMRSNEVVSFLNGNVLQDLCISRPLKRLAWGIRLPFDDNFVAYVWVDALINYFSGIGYLDNKERFQGLWPADIQVIGKDIIRHHAVYWAIINLALGSRPPKRIFAHGWWVVGGEKMSKSKGNVVDPLYLIDEKKYPVDALRYFLLSQVQFGWDGTFSEELFIEKYNADLANNLGNLLNRTLTMVEKYFNGVTPERAPNGSEQGASLGHEAERLGGGIVESAQELPARVRHFMDIEHEGPDFQGALGELWDLVDKANKFIEVSAPWKHARESNEYALRIIIDNLIQSLGIVTALLYPFMPTVAENMRSQLGMALPCERMTHDMIRWGIVPAGTRTLKGAPIFPRIDTSK
ncbi:MAG: methionine--tRNA ligase [Candidatus Omnitrophica bacterium]|nr:methionine--tRNA ligase [Candidatus Omnitrophota bacterium]